MKSISNSELDAMLVNINHFAESDAKGTFSYEGAVRFAREAVRVIPELIQELRECRMALTEARTPLPPAPEGWNPDDTTVST